MTRRQGISSMFVALLVLATGATTAETPVPKEALKQGAAMPATDVEMKNVDGTMVMLGASRGKLGTMVVFTCNACPFVKAWEGRIAALGNSFAKRGIGVVAINSNDPERVPEDDFAPMQARAKQLELAFPYVVDATSEVARAFGATRTPEVFLFDAAGTLVYHGAVDDNHAEPAAVKQQYLRDALEALTSGKEIVTRETKALGCSIKFRG